MRGSLFPCLPMKLRGAALGVLDRVGVFREFQSLLIGVVSIFQRTVLRTVFQNILVTAFVNFRLKRKNLPGDSDYYDSTVCDKIKGAGDLRVEIPLSDPPEADKNS